PPRRLRRRGVRGLPSRCEQVGGLGGGARRGGPPLQPDHPRPPRPRDVGPHRRGYRRRPLRLRAAREGGAGALLNPRPCSSPSPWYSPEGHEYLLEREARPPLRVEAVVVVEEEADEALGPDEGHVRAAPRHRLCPAREPAQRDEDALLAGVEQPPELVHLRLIHLPRPALHLHL